VTLIDTRWTSTARGHNEVLVGRAISGRPRRGAAGDESSASTAQAAMRSGPSRGEAGLRQGAGVRVVPCLRPRDRDDRPLLPAPARRRRPRSRRPSGRWPSWSGRARYGTSALSDGRCRTGCGGPHAVHPESRPSRVSTRCGPRDPETQVVEAPARARCGAWSPTRRWGRGFLTGTVDVNALGQKDFRGHNPALRPARPGRPTRAIAEAGCRRRGAGNRASLRPRSALAWLAASAGNRLGISRS